MGSLAVAWIRAEKDLEVAAEIEIGDDVGRSLAAARASVALDFTTAESARANALAILEAGARPVVGTSGLSAADVGELRAAAAKRKLGGLVVPNFSIGAVLAMRFSEEAARWMPAAEVIEAHHPTKADAPSGTARATAERIAAARREVPRDASRELIPSVRGGGVEGVRVHSIRLPGVIAHQEVRFGAEGETLSLRHDTTDRACFRAGVLLALRAAPALDEIVVGLEPLLFGAAARNLPRP